MARYQGHGRRVPRHGAARRRRRPAWQFADKTVVDKFTAKKWKELGLVPSRAVHRRAVHPPRVPRHHRHAADAEAGDRRSSPTRTPAKRDKLVDQLLDTPEYAYYFANKWADILRVKRRGETEPGRRAPSRSTTGFARRSPPTCRTTSSSATILDGHRRRDEEPADRLVQGTRQARAVRGRRAPGLPRPAAGLRQVPPPPVREVEPGRLLGPGRVLRPRRPQERRRCPAATRTSRQRGVQVDLHAADRQRDQQADAARPPTIEAARRPSRWTSPPTTTRGRSSSTGWSTRRTRSSPRRWRTATGRTSSAAASSIRSTTCASPTRRRTPNCSTRWRKNLIDNKYQPEGADQDDLQEPDVPVERARRTTSTSTTSRPTPATTRSACRPRCCSTRCAR